MVWRWSGTLGKITHDLMFRVQLWESIIHHQDLLLSPIVSKVIIICNYEFHHLHDQKTQHNITSTPKRHMRNSQSSGEKFISHPKGTNRIRIRLFPGLVRSTPIGFPLADRHQPNFVGIANLKCWNSGLRAPSQMIFRDTQFQVVVSKCFIFTPILRVS